MMNAWVNLRTLDYTNLNGEYMTAYPLQWPEGWERTSSYYRQRSRFKPQSFGRVRDELFACLKRMGAQSIVLSTNVPLKNDGMPYATFKTPEDVGVAVYFLYKKKQMVFACDNWKTIEENMLSICKTIEAIRGIERWGASEMLERAFTGFAQLEAPTSDGWWDILQCKQDSSLEVIRANYRRLAKDRHPDFGGTNEAMATLNQAYEKAVAYRMS